jgi:hypothetical protein
MIFSKILKELGVDLVIRTLGDRKFLKLQAKKSDFLMSNGVLETTKSGFYFWKVLPSSYLKFLGLESWSPRARKVSILINFKACLK